MNHVALSSFLKIFEPYFEMASVSEICINKPYEIWVEQHGYFSRYDIPELSLAYLHQFARLVAEYNHRDISQEAPTLSSSLPNGYRIQFVIEPACERGSFICSMRKPSVVPIAIKEYLKTNMTGNVGVNKNALLYKYYAEKNYEAFLKLAVRQRKNIIISGGTSTGKTTFLNGLLTYIPSHERLITIETDREVKSDHPNVVHLLAAEEGRSVADISMLGLLKASLRLRPDRILVSELRAEEAFPYLRAINSGHPGSITTLHANSPEGCFEQLAFMVIQSGNLLSRQDLITYAKSIIDVVVQINRAEDGTRYVSEVYFNETQKMTEPSISSESPIKQVFNLTQGSQ